MSPLRVRLRTGYLNDFDVVPTPGPGGNAYAVTDIDSGPLVCWLGHAFPNDDPGPDQEAPSAHAAQLHQR